MPYTITGKYIEEVHEPAYEEPSKWDWSKLPPILLAVVVLILIGVLRQYSDADDNQRDRKIAAEVGAETEVGKRLISPGSAKYTTRFVDGGPEYWDVRGSVDSQNLLGALVRSEYICKVKVVPSSYRFPRYTDEWANCTIR